MSQFKSLAPQELKAFKRAKDALVSLPTAPRAVDYHARSAEAGPAPFLHWANLQPSHSGLGPALAAVG